MAWIFLLASSIVAQVVGDFTAKDYSLNGSLKMATLTLILCTISSIFWMGYMRLHSSLAIGANVWSLATGIGALLIGVLMFHEPISTIQWVGLVLGMVSLSLIL